jgi:undecaprenyl diphosphate synthase
MTGLHVAIIMDGNGRWAKARRMPRWRGHAAGVDSVRDVVRAAPDLGIDVLTLYAFSADNWKRPPGEVRRLFSLLTEYCRRECPELVANGVRLEAIGSRDRIPRRARAALESVEEATIDGHRLRLRLAIDYSARATIAKAAAEVADAVRRCELSPDAVTPELLDHVITRGVAAPDLRIRTAGERRLSDFLLWELAYAEFWFSPVLWPDFRRNHLADALADFATRDRRFGGLTKPTRPDRLAG